MLWNFNLCSLSDGCHDIAPFPITSTFDTSVGFCFSGYYHYTSAGVVVITVKTKSNIKEAKATSSTPVSKLNAPSAGSEVALSAVSLVNYNLSGITTLGFTTSAGFEL